MPHPEPGTHTGNAPPAGQSAQEETRISAPPAALWSRNPLAWFRFFGPGAIVASVTVGSGEIVFPSRGGALFGYQLLWIYPAVALLKWGMASYQGVWGYVFLILLLAGCMLAAWRMRFLHEESVVLGQTILITGGAGDVCLRYFNAAGADPSGEIGESHRPETHVIPLAIETALGGRRYFEIFGTDYETPDGTAVRDFVHVSDLAAAHVSALRCLSIDLCQVVFSSGISSPPCGKTESSSQVDGGGPSG